MTITLVEAAADVAGILALQQQNLPRHLPSDVQAKQGFVTVEHRPDVLTRMNQAAPSVIAKEGNTVVGYALTMLPDFAADVPELASLFAHIATLTYEGRPLSDYAYYVMGQVCVAAGYRGQGLFDRLYEHHRAVYSNRYRLLITDISARNTRSLRAHERVGFRPLQTFHEPSLNESWVVVAWDWQK